MARTAQAIGRAARWLAAPPEPATTAGYLWPRWIFLRLLGVWFFSVFYSLWYQAPGLIGPRGILPAGELLDGRSFLEVPTLLRLGTSDRAMAALCLFGLLAAVLLILNVWPRLATAACTIAFLSFTTTLQVFASYQSDGMLLEAGLLSIIFAPRGFRPGLGADAPPSRLSLFALQWLCFRIYFESGLAKLRSHDPQWRALTAMDHYYENGPLPTWLGWYVQQRLPHGFHAATAFMTLAGELVLIWAIFLPRAVRIPICFVLTAFQAGIILTANYAFLNYLVLSLGLLLLDDRFFARLGLRIPTTPVRPRRIPVLAIEGAILAAQIYATTLILLGGTIRLLPEPAAKLMTEVLDAAPSQPGAWLGRYRLANGYGLFASMTKARYEIELEGSNDGEHWAAYPFRYKPQDPKEPPGIYAPYQPRFEWNLWFASLGDWHRDQWVLECEQRLLTGSPEVLALFRDDPFHGHPPAEIRAVRWQYWFATPEEKTRDGVYWRRERLDAYGPMLQRLPEGQIVAVDGT